MKQRDILQSVPKSVRAIFNFLLVILFILVMYVSFGCPTFSARDSFRREELRQAVGHAKILDIVSLEDYTVSSSYNRVILATSDDSITMYLYNRDKRYISSRELICREKQGGISVYAVPSITHRYLEEFFDLRIPVIVFDDLPEAVRADMEIELYSCDVEGNQYHQQFQLSATRKRKGYFVFDLTSELGFSRIRTALNNLTRISSNTLRGLFGDLPIPVTVRFYNANNELIYTESVEIRSSASEAHNNVEGKG